MKTNFLTLTITLFIVYSISASGAFLRNVPQSLEQPDGSILNCLATGDEFHNWLHDENNYTIIQHPQTGFYVYAEIKNGKLVASDWVAGKVDPAGLGLQPGLNISQDEYLEKRRIKSQFPGYKSYKATSNIGKMNNLVVFIRFKYQNEFTENSSYYENAFNGTNMVSMNSYYDVVSNKQLDIKSHIFPSNNSTTVVSYQDSHPRSYYQPYNAASNPGGYTTDNMIASREHTLLKDATEFVRSQIEGMNLNLDMDNDGNVDNIVYIIQGRTDGWSDLLWPHKWALYSYDIYLNGAKIWWYNFQLSEAFNVSVLCHEMFHSLGAPDLYRYKDRNLTPVGPWDLMAETTTPPQHMGVYMKMKYGGWINSIPSITSGGNYTLESLSNDPYAAYKIASPNSSSEYFVIEYRHKTGQFESSLPGSGLIMYRVNPSIDGNADGPPDEVYIYRPNGTTTQNGNIYKAYFSSQAANTSFDDNSNPSCFLSNGSPGGIKIQNIGSAGTNISFDVVMGSSFQPPRNLTASVSGSSVSISWLQPLAGNGTLSGYKVFRNGNLISTITNSVTLNYSDNGLANGQYNYYLKATYTSPTGESPESNVASANIGTSERADLLITDAVVNPVSIEPGGRFDISCKYVNNGTANAGESMLRLFFSSDQNLDASDIHFAYGSMDPIDSGAALNITGEELTVPTDINAGNWYVLFVADADENVVESNEDNNVSVVGVSITSEGFKPPRNLNGTVSGSSVDLFWDSPESGSATLSGYKIYRNSQLINTVNDPESLEYYDSGLSSGSYTYYVSAIYSSPSGESELSNPLNVTVTSSSRADLTILDQMVSPDAVNPGDYVEISCLLINNGDAVAGESTLRLFFSRDEILDNQDVEMAYGTFGELDPGYYYDIVGGDILIPNDLTNGVWQVLFVADADEEVTESIESNNIAIFQITVGSTNFNPPQNLSASVSDRDIILTWDTPDAGNGVLSGFNVFREGAFIALINDPAELNFRDSGLDPGEYQYYVTANYINPSGESPSSNIVSVEIISTGNPDLVISDASVDPTIIDPGGTLSVSCKLENLGTTLAEESMMRVYISRDESVDAQDEELASGSMTPVNPGEYIQVTGSDLELSSSISSGVWYVIFVADADENVSESNELNNSEALLVSVGESVFNPPKNLQGTVSGNSIELFWDSPDPGQPNLSVYRVYRNGTFYASVDVSGNQSFTDSQLDYATYSYSVTAEYDNPSGESNPSNELVITISSDSKPDLTIRNAVVFPTFLDPGGVVSISCDLLNTGNTLAGYSHLRLFLSKNDVLDYADQSLAYGSMDPIDPGSSINITGEDLPIPENLTSGDWFVFFVADADEEVNESIEDNNIAIIQISVASKKPDLVITSLYLIRDYANPGDMMRLTVFIYNDGLGVTVPSKASFYLSEDEYLDEQDLFLNDITVKKMSGEELIFKNNYVTIPANAVRGPYYLIAYIDVYQTVAETDEENNTFAVPITVGSSGIEHDELSGRFSVYPIPALDLVFFKYEGPVQGQTVFSIFDQLGREMYSHQLELSGFWTESLDVSAWQKGFYYVKIMIGDKQHVYSFIKL